jgi:thiaminase/transcriptional activator TenA
MSNWFNTVREKTVFILEKIKVRPFIIELKNGTLPKNIFQFSIKQDSRYLSEYKKIIALLGVKCAEINDTQFFLNAVTGIIIVVDELHKIFLNSEPYINAPTPTYELFSTYNK